MKSTSGRVGPHDVRRLLWMVARKPTASLCSVGNQADTAGALKKDARRIEASYESYEHDQEVARKNAVTYSG